MCLFYYEFLTCMLLRTLIRTNIENHCQEGVCTKNQFSFSNFINKFMIIRRASVSPSAIIILYNIHKIKHVASNNKILTKMFY